MKIKKCPQVHFCNIWHVGPYTIEKVSTNAVKLRLLASIRIYPVVNISRVMRYRKLVKRQKIKKPKLIKINGEKE